jgi:dihydrofolate reductase
MIVAMTPRRAIGAGGKLPWHLPEDLKRFKQLTTGHAIVMGRKTFVSIGRALPNRLNIVVTRSEITLPPETERCASVDEAIDLARSRDPEPFIIGGGEIYRAALPRATHLHVTLVEGIDDTAADAFFPEIDPAVFEAVTSEAGATPGTTFIEYVRR